MTNIISNIFKPAETEKINESEFEQLRLALKDHVSAIFGRSLAIRVLDAGDDNSSLIELVNLTAPHYDVERFGISFVASPRHADVLVVTGPITINMAVAAKKTYDAMPDPKFVVAIGDGACDGGLLKDSYAVLGGADKLFKVDLKIRGNPPAPLEIMRGLLSLLEAIKKSKSR